jgi:hypothetical protein
MEFPGRSEAAGLFPRLQHQYLLSLAGQIGGTNETVMACANYDGVVSIQKRYVRVAGLIVQ